MTSSAPLTPDCNTRLIALLVIGSILLLGLLTLSSSTTVCLTVPLLLQPTQDLLLSGVQRAIGGLALSPLSQSLLHLLGRRVPNAVCLSASLLRQPLLNLLHGCLIRIQLTRQGLRQLMHRQMSSQCSWRVARDCLVCLRRGSLWSRLCVVHWHCNENEAGQ